ncbi:MAG: serine/threonine-protein kinase [Candidatus Sumerlaeia bacterium]|nr:serine/threonine-protein kinase [Candidatus Sumerlaeia bacterium]
MSAEDGNPGPDTPITGPDKHDQPTIREAARSSGAVRRVQPPSQAPIPIWGVNAPPPLPPAPAAGAADPDPKLACAGHRLGPYILERELARGGMGAVYLGYDPALRRHAAIKTMLRDALADEDAARRFQREARACAALAHPNIAAVYFVGEEEDGSPFLAMEYVDGGSLQEVIRTRRAVPHSRAAEWMAQAAEALRTARKIGIIHRDLKPGNLMTTRDGVLKVVDFGLAKVMFDDTYRTVEGMVMGTPKYMPPEQAAGRGIDHRADIYALGATFFHLLAGRAPFDGDTSMQVMMKHATAPVPSLRSLKPDVPMEFDAVIQRCLRKDPNDRYQEYEELVSDLRAVQLQARSREAGPVLDAGGAASHSFAPPRPSHSATQIPLPSEVRSIGPRPQEAAEEQSAEEPSMHWGLKAALAFAAVAAVAMGVSLAFRPGAEKSEPVAAPAERSPLTELIGRLASESGLKPEEADGSSPRAQYVRYQASRVIVEALASGAARFESQEGRAPLETADFSGTGFSTRVFETNARGAALDAWGNEVVFTRAGRELRSAGLNQRYGDDDDIVWLGGSEQPPASDGYERLKAQALGGR